MFVCQECNELEELQAEYEDLLLKFETQVFVFLSFPGLFQTIIKHNKSTHDLMGVPQILQVQHQDPTSPSQALTIQLELNTALENFHTLQIVLLL